MWTPLEKHNLCGCYHHKYPVLFKRINKIMLDRKQVFWFSSPCRIYLKGPVYTFFFSFFSMKKLRFRPQMYDIAYLQRKSVNYDLFMLFETAAILNHSKLPPIELVVYWYTCMDAVRGVQQITGFPHVQLTEMSKNVPNRNIKIKCPPPASVLKKKCLRIKGFIFLALLSYKCNTFYLKLVFSVKCICTLCH